MLRSQRRLPPPTGGAKRERLLSRRGDRRIERASVALLLVLFLGASALGQPAAKVPHIGWLDFWPKCDSSWLESGLRDLGYVPEPA
jgi:hypothetical protein